MRGSFTPLVDKSGTVPDRWEGVDPLGVLELGVGVSRLFIQNY
jgi:hypothetical protein